VANNFEIQKGVEILKNPSNYLSYFDWLNPLNLTKTLK
jgi:hypothetical protein